MTVAAACTSDESTAQRLLTAAGDEAQYPSAYEFREVPDASGLFECLGFSETVIGVVDVARSVAAFGRDGEAFPIVVWTPDEFFVRADAITEDATGEWVSMSASAPPELRAQVTRALGPSLGAYATAGALPAHPAALARGGAAAAQPGDVVIDESGDREVRVLVDDETLSSIVGEASGVDLAMTFVLDDQGRVISVDPVADNGDGAESFGFLLIYRWAGPLEVVLPAADAVVDAIDVSSMVVQRPSDEIDCAIGP